MYHWTTANSHLETSCQNEETSPMQPSCDSGSKKQCYSPTPPAPQWSCTRPRDARCQAGRACPRGLKPQRIVHTMHHDEDVAVSPVLIQAIVTQRPTCSNIEMVEVDDFARPGAVHGHPKLSGRTFSPRIRIRAMATLTNSVTWSSMLNKQQYSDSHWRVAPRWPAFFT